VSDGSDPKAEAYGRGILAGHEWWQHGHEGKRTVYPPNPEIDPELAAEWSRGFEDGSDDAAKEDGW
jgi:hypothetical protein